jgi:hypothetical protein
VKVAYSDESGLGSIEKEPISVVTAIVMSMDKTWPALEAEMREIVRDTPESLLYKERELHGALLYSAARKEIPEKEVAREILARTLAVTINEGIAIFYGAVDRKGWHEYATKTRTTPLGESTSMDAADRAFDACMAFVDRYASEKDEHILWIADHSTPKRENTTKVGLPWIQSLKDGGWDPLTFKYIRPRYDRVRIADAVYFGHSHESLALQLADVCCSTITLHLLEKFYGWRPVAEPFYEMIRRGVFNDTAPEYMSKRES